LELLERLGFDLANAFARDLKDFANLFERVFAAVVKSKSHLDDIAFSRRQRFQNFFEFFVESVISRRMFRSFKGADRNKIAKSRVGGVANGAFKTDRGRTNFKDALHVFGIHLGAQGKFFVRKFAAETLEPVRVIEVAGRDGTPSRVGAVYQAPDRKSFILALKDAPEIWEIATDPEAGPFHDGLVHSHEKGMEESFGAQKGLFARRRMMVEEPLDDFFFDPGYRNLIGTNREGTKGVVVNLITGTEIAELPLPGMPHLGSGITWDRDGHKVMATPHLNEGVLSVIDMTDWTLVKQIQTNGPGFFLRSHETSPHVWADVFFGPHKDEVHIIDKQTLEIVETLNPAPGKTVAHTEFTRDGKYALVSIWEDDGAVVVYDAATLKEVRRLPMRKPSGKYNVWNKITFSDGTSHERQRIRSSTATANTYGLIRSSEARLNLILLPSTLDSDI